MGVRNLLLYYYRFFALNGVNVGVAWSFHYAVRLQSSEAVFYFVVYCLSKLLYQDVLLRSSQSYLIIAVMTGESIRRLERRMNINNLPGYIRALCYCLYILFENIAYLRH